VKRWSEHKKMTKGKVKQRKKNGKQTKEVNGCWLSKV